MNKIIGYINDATDAKDQAERFAQVVNDFDRALTVGIVGRDSLLEAFFESVLWARNKSEQE